MIFIKKPIKSTKGRIPKPPPYHQHHQEDVRYNQTRNNTIPAIVSLAYFFIEKINPGTSHNKIGAYTNNPFL